MEDFETVLAGTDGAIDGFVSAENHADYTTQYTFTSLDGSLILTIAKDEHGNWKRISSSEPYLSGWIEELGHAIDQQGSGVTY